MPELVPKSLKDASALIESIFPAQKISFEAQRERKAGASQILTALGSYWKGRKPLILVRAIVLGSLLPQTEDTEKDLDIFEKLMAFDAMGLAKRAYMQGKIKPKDIAANIALDRPWDYFAYTIKRRELTAASVEQWEFPLDIDEEGIALKWRKDVSQENRISLISATLKTFPSYEAKAALCKRPEELDQEWLYASIWPDINDHYRQFGIEAFSHQELVEKLGILRYGHRPKVGDTFSGGGSIPFEAARLGCDVYASDLNPIACMLTWGGFNIIGATPENKVEIEKAQRDAANAVDDEMTALGIEHDCNGNRAKAYLYCLEVRCPETGWLVPMAPSWVISKTRNTVARLIPDHSKKRFDIDVVTGVSVEELKSADEGTVKAGSLVYELDGVIYRTPIKTLRGDYRDSEGQVKNRLRAWEKTDFKPRDTDTFYERLYAIQWITKESLNKKTKETYFSSVTSEDLERERKVEAIVEQKLSSWQEDGYVPDMEIESGYNTDQPIRERGWTYWHHLFNPRQLLFFSSFRREASRISGDASGFLCIKLASLTDYVSKLVRWTVASAHSQGGGREVPDHVFTNQALNTLYNYASRSWASIDSIYYTKLRPAPIYGKAEVRTSAASDIEVENDIYLTDPPYADAVHYHEITEYFISWLRKNRPEPFDQWTWDSRRALAIKGSGDDFRRGMVDAYKAMADHMPDNGMQCVMFTHQDTGVWSDMVGIFWAAGLQVVSAWYIATETTSELKKGGYVQGTVILMLRKRPVGERSGFKQRILPAVRNEVNAQIEQMMHLNEEVEGSTGEPVFNDSDLQMAGYAAALKVLTAYTQIGGEEVTSFALRPRQAGEVTVVDEIVQQAAEAANSLLVPEGLSAETWQRISGIQRFYLRMMDMETNGASKLDNYQNFAKAFRVDDYTKVMGSMTANKAHLTGIKEFTSRELTDSTEIGSTWLGRLIIGVQQMLADTEPQVVVSQLQVELPEFMEARLLLIDMLQFIAVKSPDAAVRESAEVLANRLQNLRALGQ